MQFTWNDHTTQPEGLSDSLEEVSSKQLQLLQLINFILECYQENETCEDLKTLKQELLTQSNNHSDITCINYILYHKNPILLTPILALKSALLEEFHSSPMGGNAGTSKTYSLLNTNITWKGMKGQRC